MTAQVIDGEAVAGEIRAAVARAALALKERHGDVPALATVLVGDDPASDLYVTMKGRDTKAAGMRAHDIRLPAATAEADLIARVRALSEDPLVDGILVQLPLPAHIRSDLVLAALDPDKDVDGLTERSAGRLLLGKPGLRPCTPEGCVILAKTAQADLAGAHCVVVGRSILVGKPAAQLFLAENCTVTTAHSRTADLRALCRQADILVPAMGRAGLIGGDWIKPGAIVIDVGTNRVPAPRKKKPNATKTVGDVNFAEAVEVAGWITPVPGGVGPMTRAGLLRNTVRAACARRGWAMPDI
jgi:methylenetetrahydrofolate dehydrogenase (NADP+)/methenyltetrahydrofolate cyclohydrolase